MNTPRNSFWKQNAYTNRFEKFDAYMRTHRQHQTEAIVAASTASKGQIISPCGTGKTRIQVSLHIADMIRLSNQGECGVYAIASHRLILNKQLLGQLISVAADCGLSFDVLYVGSAHLEVRKYYDYTVGYTNDVSRFFQSTNTAAVEKFIAEAKSLRRHVIVASTYDSFDCLKNVGAINLITYDEAHNTTQRDFTANIAKVKANTLKEYFFTATRKVFGEAGGMNDEAFYGPILIDLNPKEMLERGEITCPMIHVIDGENDQTTTSDDIGMLTKNTIEAFEKHKALVKGHSSNPDSIGAKLLISCSSIDEMEKIYANPDFITFALSMKTFVISSDRCVYNHIKCDKEKFFEHFNKLSDSEDAIVFNVDMLMEGIDLPSITGVMPLRNLGQTKLIQMVGRALRLNVSDRKALYSMQIAAGQYDKYVKPFGYLIIPRHIATITAHENMIERAKSFYKEYGTPPEQMIIQESYSGNEPEELDSMIEVAPKSKKDYDLVHSGGTLVDETYFSILSDDISALDTIDGKIAYMDNMFSAPSE